MILSRRPRNMMKKTIKRAWMRKRRFRHHRVICFSDNIISQYLVIVKRLNGVCKIFFYFFEFNSEFLQKLISAIIPRIFRNLIYFF